MNDTWFLILMFGLMGLFIAGCIYLTRRHKRKQREYEEQQKNKQ